MQGFKAKFRVATLVAVAVWTGLAALYGLLKPISNGCIMTYMYPTYIPISSLEGVSSEKYGLYLYHEGWKKIDFKEHLKKLSGIPVLFIPGNGGSYKQVRSLAAESDRAYQGGPLEHTFYQEASLTPEEGGVDFDVAGFQLPNRYTSRLDWFAVDLEGEHSAMDGGILEEHTEYVVNAIHRILDQYRASYDVREKEGAATSGSLPKSVLLVGHSMGGFVARAAIIHPRLRKSAVETVLTLSSPHQSPPVALQPSLGHYFASVNQQWRKGYEVEATRTGRFVSDPVLSHVVVVSISGGYHDYQVRTKLESLDGIVPPTNGFLISSTGMKNVWLSMEHQAILWCNQLVIQVSHTLLSLIDSRTGQPYVNAQQRLAIFTRMLRSGIPPSFNWKMQSQLASQKLKHVPMKDVKHAAAACPSNVHWTDDGLERDLYIQTTTVTVLAMDGRRRWLDIQKLGSNGKNHFIFVTNLAPCSGVRLHMWPEKGTSNSNLPLSGRVVEVTLKMVSIPSGPAPTQIIGFSIAVVFFALMRQARSWDLDLPIPSMLLAVESNLRMPVPIFLLAVVPILVSLLLTSLMSQPFPPFASFIIVSVVCYLFANGFIIILILVTQSVFYVAAIIHIFIKTRWEVWEGKVCFGSFHRFINLFSRFSSLKVVRVLRVNPLLVTALTAVMLACLVHPALGLFALLIFHALGCHKMLCSFLTASFRSHAWRKELFGYKNKGNDGSRQFTSKFDERSNQRLPLEENSSNRLDSPKSFGDNQLEMFHHRHGMLILHLVAALMFAPSLVAWLQRIGMGQSFPWFLDSALCTGVILHGICNSKPEFNYFLFSFPGIPSREVRLDFVYLVAGYYSYLSGLALAPYRAIYVMAAIGFISFVLRTLQRRNREKGEVSFGSRKHSHRH
ncbi:hypothetical protein I3760_03G043100 [Carya illinoinensis]|nr:hypothetical protein I3760_03G043100 [Carya illinoinensis]